MTDSRETHRPRSSSSAAKNNTRPIIVSDLFICLALGGLILVLLVPGYRKAREQAFQNSTAVDIRIWSDALAAYAAAHQTLPRHEGPLSLKHELVQQLRPYLRALRTGDRWGWELQIWAGSGIQKYGLTLETDTDFIVASFGADGIAEQWTYDERHPENGLFEILDSKDYNKDLVLWNSQFIRNRQ